jgi:uncharacterized protein YecE (DUF72 family)
MDRRAHGAHDGTQEDLNTMKSDQLSLFPASASDAARDASAGVAALEARYDRLRALATALPDTLRMGTSSWSFPGWRGIVYDGAETASSLARDGLRQYAKHPLLRTVGLDRSYYAPVPEEDLRRYADQLPADFLCCIKAPAAVTAFVMKKSPKPQPNPDFLSAARFIEEMIVPFQRWFAPHTGPFIFQFAPLPARASLDPAAFAEMLDSFFDRLPREAEYAVEIRDRSLLSDAYRRVLERNGVVHVCNYWSAMPMPGEQADVVVPPSSPFTMVRLLMRPGTRYEQQRETMAPFNRIVQQDEHMRRDVASLLARAAGRGQRAFLLVNNKAEGSSPLTIEAIAERLTAVRDRITPPC